MCILQQSRSSDKSLGLADAFHEAKTTVQLLKRQGIGYRLTGAGCSSLISYLIKLSEINPMEHGLLYERFLEANPFRNIQFRFVAHPQTDGAGVEFWPIQDRLSSGAVSIQQATSREAMPYFVAEEIRKKSPDFQRTLIPLNDGATFEALRSGNVEGIEFFEGIESRRLLSDMKPRSLGDIAAIAVIQIGEAHEPGLMKEFIRRGIKRDHKRPGNWTVDEMLEDTRGMILFQQQIMLILNRVADIPLADAYSFIKAVCKRQWENVATIREWFLIGTVANGVNEPDALSLFEGIHRRGHRHHERLRRN